MYRALWFKLKFNNSSQSSEHQHIFIKVTFVNNSIVVSVDIWTKMLALCWNGTANSIKKTYILNSIIVMWKCAWLAMSKTSKYSRLRETRKRHWQKQQTTHNLTDDIHCREIVKVQVQKCRRYITTDDNSLRYAKHVCMQFWNGQQTCRETLIVKL